MTTPSVPARPPVPLRAPVAVTWIVRTLEAAGHETWAVGGAVRDALAGLPSGDWDLATHARPGQMRKTFRRTVPIGVDHGTIGILAKDGTMYEVTTFRQDVETTGRRATVRFAETLDEDLARRDFTINAVAWHPLRNELRDPFHGAEDLVRGVLRTVGDPDRRFAEDYLRILRALRFAGVFSLTIDDATWEAIRSGVSELGILSPERVREEMMKILAGDPGPSAALKLYRASGVLDVLYPELAPLTESDSGGETPWERALRVVDRLSRRRPLLRLAALLGGVGVPGTLALMERLRFSNSAIDEVAGIVGAAGGRLLPLPPESAPAAEIRRWLSRVSPDRLPSLTRLGVAGVRALRRGGSREDDVEGGSAGEGAPAGEPAHPDDRRDPACPGAGKVSHTLVRRWRRVRSELRARPALAVDDLALDGRDLIAMGLKPGPRFGRILRALLEEVLERPEKNDRVTLAAIVQHLLEEEEDGDAEGR